MFMVANRASATGVPHAAPVAPSPKFAPLRHARRASRAWQSASVRGDGVAAPSRAAGFHRPQDSDRFRPPRCGDVPAAPSKDVLEACPMNGRTARGRGAVVLLVVCFALAWIGGCSGASGPPQGVTTTGQAVCAAACAKPCSQDSDCQTSSGELCCDYGSAGKVCQSAASCPQFCANDTTCDSATGQACVVTSLEPSAQRSCQKAQDGLQLCKTDTDCTTPGNVCCGIYDQGICLPSNECPKTCATSSECQTALGEVCCTSVKAIDPTVTAAGLCLDPKYAPCPKACTSSTDCASTGELCCNGICQATCPKACSTDSDCSGAARICCPTASAHAAEPPHVFKTGPTCSGTPAYPTCAACATGAGCGGCAGCETPGTCTGTPSGHDCSTCGASYGCSACEGCTTGAPGTGACAGSPDYTSCASCGSSCASCQGCTSGGSACTGTPYYPTCASCPASACGTSECQGCTAIAGTGGCTGTPYTCSYWSDTLTSYQ